MRLYNHRFENSQGVAPDALYVAGTEPGPLEETRAAGGPAFSVELVEPDDETKIRIGRTDLVPVEA